MKLTWVILEEGSNLLKGNFFLLLKVNLGHVHQQKLKIKTGITCQFLQVFAYISQNQPLYYQEIWIPPNSRKLDLASDGRDKGLDR